MSLTELILTELQPTQLDDTILVPTNIEIGRQLFTNPNFSFMTLGPEVMDDPGFDSPGDWTTTQGWAVTGGQAVMIWAGSAGNIISNNLLTAYQSYQLEIETISNTFDGTCVIRNTTFGSSHDVTNVGILIICDANVGASPLSVSMRAANGTAGIITLDNVTVKKATLDSWTELGTRTQNNYMIFNTCPSDAQHQSVQIVSSGPQMGIGQNIGTGTLTVDNYFYHIDIESITGDLKLTSGAGSISFDSAGVYRGVTPLPSSVMTLEADGACDAVINSFRIYPVIG